MLVLELVGADFDSTYSTTKELRNKTYNKIVTTKLLKASLKAKIRNENWLIRKEIGQFQGIPEKKPLKRVINTKISFLKFQFTSYFSILE